MSMEIQLIFALDVFSFLGFALILLDSRNERSDQIQQIFNVLLRFLLLAIIADMVSWMHMEVHTPLEKAVGTVSTFTTFLLQNISWWVWVLYVYSFLGRTRTRKSSMIFLFSSAIPFLFFFGFMVVSLFNGCLFYYDEAGLYTRGPLHPVIMGTSIFYELWFACLAIIEYRSTEEETSRRYLVYIFLFMFVPLLGGLAEQFFFGINTYASSAFLGILFVYLNVQKRRMNDLEMSRERALKDLENSKVKMMLGQVRPHFIFNSLNCVRTLIRRNPDKAVEALEKFSEYLRDNVSTVDSDGCVSFRDELHHVENYIYIEKMRFGDLVDVEYEIKTSDFAIPALSLQVLVENAVKHGILAKDGGGKVKIMSWVDDDTVMVRVEDNGAGYVSENNDDIYYVRMRLRELVGAELRIENTRDRGTRATILIPLYDSSTKY